MADPLASDSLVQAIGCQNQYPQESFCETLIMPDTLDVNDNDAAPKQKKQPPSLRRLSVFFVDDESDDVPIISYPTKSRKLK